MDWGSYHPYACYWIAVDYDGVMYVYRELYGYGGKANVGTKEPSTLVAQRIADSERADKRLIRYAVLDNACWGKQDTGAPSIAEEINRVLMDNGCMMFNPSVKGREQVGEEIRLRLQGWEDREGKRHPGIKVFNTCFHLIRTLPEITHDKNQPEKYDTNGEDHCLIAGTLITTKRGDIPIEEVTTNDYVLTRQGYRRVLAAGLTRRSAKVITITCDNGKSLTGTGNHPIYIKGKDFIPLDAITYGDIMYSIGGKNIALTNTEVVKLVVESAVRNYREEQEPADVYNLTVDEVHEYFANGFLVHNCIDAIGYGCMSRPWKPTAPKNQGKRDGWKFDYNNESNSRRSFMGV